MFQWFRNWSRHSADDVPRPKKGPGDLAQINIVVRMCGLALAGRHRIAKFSDSASPGNRLVAVVMLQMRPDPVYFKWLVDRLHLEQPFIVNQALHALLRATDTPDPSGLKKLLNEWVLSDDGRRVLAQKTAVIPLFKSLLDHLDIST